METKNDSRTAENPCAECTPAYMQEQAGAFPCMCCIAELQRQASDVQGHCRQLELFEYKD